MASGYSSDLRPRAQAALAASPVHELHDLRVEQRPDAILISGKVSSFYHKQLAQEAVRAVCEQIDVINSIQVN